MTPSPDFPPQEAEAAPETIGAEVLRIEAAALAAMASALPAGFGAAVHLLRHMRGRAIISGMGKSGHVARKIASTLASTGTPAIFVHPAEASHGDLGMISEGDVCLLLSNSGETAELKDLIAHTRRFSIPMIAMCKVADSTLARAADVMLILPDAPEACAIGMAPTTSTTLSMALGDALAVALMRERGFRADDFLTFHPGGKLGAKLLKVGSLMHPAAEVALLAEDTPMSEGIVEITRRGFGTAGIVTGGRLVGVVTDGDIRRNLSGLLERRAGDVASRHPRTISPEALASEALAIMNRERITALFVTDAEGRPAGLIHLHDCLRAGVM